MEPYVISTCSISDSEVDAVDEMAERLRLPLSRGELQGGFVYAHVAHNPVRLQKELRRALPNVPFVGASSCAGVGVSDKGFVGKRSVAGLWLCGKGFRFGVAGQRKAPGPSAGSDLTKAALNAAKISESHVRFAVVHTTPGDEERLVAGIGRQLPAKTPILGGSAADDDLSGGWQVWTSDFVGTDAAVIAVCDWPWRVGVHYSGGQFPTKHVGRVTEAKGRTLYRINDRPAAEVYNEWLQGKLSAALRLGANILQDTAMCPLGLPRQVGWATTHLLVHPERVVLPGKALRLFAEVKEGDEIVLMESSQSTLVQHSARIAEFAMGANDLAPKDICGAMLVYCAGCLLAIGDGRTDMLARFAKSIGEAPFIAQFAYGEQGNFSREVAHGNLMSGVLLLSRSKIAERATPRR